MKIQRQQTFKKTLIRVGWLKDMTELEKQMTYNYTDKVHYLGMTSSNVRAIGYMVEDYELWASLVAKFPSLNTWFYSFSRHDYEQVNKDVIQINRLVCHYRDDARKLLKAFEVWAVSNGFKYIESYPSDDKREVCNKQFFEDSNYKCYGTTKRMKSFKMIKTLSGVPIEVNRPYLPNGKMPHHSPSGTKGISLHKQGEFETIFKRDIIGNKEG